MVLKNPALYVALLTVSSVTASCYSQRVPRSVRKNFSICASRDTVLTLPFQTAGYYTTKQSYTSDAGNRHDPFEVNMIFYPDGFLVFNFYDLNNPAPGDTKGYLRAVYEGAGKDGFDNAFYWGVYKVVGDTIVAQVTFNHGRPTVAPWEAYEYKFAVKNRTTLQFLEQRRLASSTKSEAKILKAGIVKQYTPAVFVPSSYIPPSDSWLKKESWIWCESK